MIIQKHNKVKYCRVCGIELTENNWLPSGKKYGVYRCRECTQKYRRSYNKKTSKKDVERNFLWRKEHMLFTTDENGKQLAIRCDKRTFRTSCEICGKVPKKKISYHHWDDDRPQWGLWLCGGCHMAVERLEKIPNFKENYLELKKKVEKGKI